MSAAETIDLALALHANPQRAVELRARPLPAQGIGNLLRIALAQPEALQEAVSATDLPPELLVDAARFFVEQQMLLQECEHDPWRVLGAQPGAPEAQLREHQRLLVSLVHPDRSSDWPGAFADRVNKAWRALRSAEGRAQHDSSQLGALPVSATLPVVATPSAFRPRFVTATVPGAVHRAPHRLRYLPALLVGGIVVVAGGVLLLDDWVREQYGQSSAPVIAAMPETDAAEQGVANQGQLLRETFRFDAEDAASLNANPPQWQSESGVAQGLGAFFAYLDNWRLLQRARPGEAVATVAAPAEVPPSVVPEIRQPASVELIATPVTASPAGLPSAPLRPAAARRRPALLAVAPPVPESSSTAEAPLFDSRPATGDDFIAPDLQPAASVIASSAISQGSDRQLQVRLLLDRFGVHYQQGDLIGLLDLFSLDANQEHGGVPSLAARYSQVFGSTRSRSVRFEGIHWKEERGHIRGAANVQITTWSAGQSRRELRIGRVEFEVLLDGDRALIRRWVPSGEAGEA